MITEQQRAFIDRQAVAHLATADPAGVPHVVPICFVVIDETLYLTIDQKPKQITSRPLKRIRNIMSNAEVAVVVDHYDDDWSRLGWVMLRGRAEIIEGGGEHARAQAALKQRYPQYIDMDLAQYPVIAVRISRATQWGSLVPAVSTGCA
jgi:PPOX class probable F420-dependent enzyme